MRFKMFQFLFIATHFFLEAYNPEDHLKNPESPENRVMLTNLGAEPSCIAGGCVNVISGSYSDHEVDLTIPSPEPFVFARSYCSMDSTLGVLRGGTHVNHEGRVTIRDEKGKYHKEISARHSGPYGTRTFFQDLDLNVDRDFFALNPMYDTLQKGVTNAFQGSISAHTDPEQIRFEYNFNHRKVCGIRYGSGEMHQFQKLKSKSHDRKLISIEKTSGFTFKYSYDDDGRLRWCTLYNRAGIEVGFFRILREKNKITVIPPDGRKVDYVFTGYHDDFPVLTYVNRPERPDVFYQIEKGDYKVEDGNILGYRERIIKKNYPDKRCLAINYYRKGHNKLGIDDLQIKTSKDLLLNRVRTLSAPVGEDDTLVITHSFNYLLALPRSTAVIDAYNNHTFYGYSEEDRLTYVRKCEQCTPYTEETLDWGGCLLVGRKFGKYGAHPTYQLRYKYNNDGNIKEEVLTGNITGTGEQTKNKICTYNNDAYHLITSIKEGPLLKEFAYIPNSNLLKECFYSDENGILLRYFYEYDDNGMVIRSISDDGITKDKDNLQGVTQRKVEETTRTYYYPAGLPLEIKTSYLDTASGTLVPVRYEQNAFDPQGRCIQTTTRDGSYQFLRSQNWTYDAYGNLIQEQNSLGDLIQRSYDENGNLIKEEGPLPNLFKTFKYDYSNRLIQIDEHHPDGVFSQKFSYNYLSHRTKSVDPFGNVTHYENDCFGRLIKEIGPTTENGSPETTYTYNELSYPTSITDPNGNTTRTSYTIFGKPYRIEYPDGTYETTEYNLESQPIVHIAKNGTKTVYTRDILGRILKTEVFDSEGQLLTETHAVYNSNHLLSETDPAGHLTTHTYDFRGRRISIAKEDQIIQFEYDELDRVIRTTQGDCVSAVVYDALDRIVEERQEDANGTILKKTIYEYDQLGRKTLIDHGEGRVIKNTYDTHGVLVKTVDPEGNQTFTETTYRPNIISTTTDPKGVKTITHFNARGKAYKTQKFSSFGSLLHQVITKYDLNGNTIQIQDHPFANGIPLEVQIQKLEYNSLNRLVSSIQAANSVLEKRSEIHYNQAGQKEAVVKPNGIQIHHTYDPLGRLHEYFSSDQSFHYRYTYDLNSNPILIEDLIHQTQTTRHYNLYNQITSETLQNGLNIAQCHNPAGQLTSLTLPDQSSVNYTYQAHQIKSAMRLSHEKIPQYAHTFDTYDLHGQITQETLLHNIGNVKRSYTPSGRLKSSHSSFFSEIMPENAYDPAGNLLVRTIKDPSIEYEETFAYDSLNQLVKEDGIASHTFAYDSMHNRLNYDDKNYTTNTLNQILSDEESDYAYDLSGNLIQINSSEGIRTLHYDALDRLTKVQMPHATVEYTYDEMNRCLSRKCTDSTDLNFFYLGQIEIGACNPEGSVVQFQLLGPGRKTEPCASVAIELDGIPFALLHDQSGHIRCLVDSEGTPTAIYRYSAFGPVQQETKLKNPWTFAGKRTDPATGYVLFGRRFYAPSIGRWITQDPAGYNTSPNLYAYLLNSPLVHYDAFGLYEFSLWNTMGNVGSQMGQFAMSAMNLSKNFVTGLSGCAGFAIHTLGRNIIPIPVIKDIPMAAGYFLQHGSLKGYTPSYSEDHSSILQAGSGGQEGIGRMIFCGMGNNKIEAQELTNQSSAAHGGERVWGVHGASHGFTSDIMEVVLQALGVRTNQVKVAERAIQEHKGSKWTSIEAHSRGGRTLDTASRAFSPEVQQTFWVGTYGTAKMMDGDRFARATNYVSKGDYVPLIADPFAYIQARLFGNPWVKFLPSQSFFEHGVAGDTYRGAMDRNATRFNEFIGMQ